MPNTVPTGCRYLIDFRSAAANVPSYKRSTQKVMAQSLRILLLTSDHELPGRPLPLSNRIQGVNIVAQVEHFFLKISLEGFVKKLLVCFIVVVMSGVAAFAANDEREEDRVKDAGMVLKEILNIPDDIPQDLLDKAECLVILPSVKKGAFGIGGSYGRGVMVCRSGEHYKGKWGAPALYALEGVSIGFQLGGQATDFVLLVMNPKGAGSLLYSKVKLGADASAAAGPKGRTAEGATDIVMSAEILS